MKRLKNVVALIGLFVFVLVSGGARSAFGACSAGSWAVISAGGGSYDGH